MLYITTLCFSSISVLRSLKPIGKIGKRGRGLLKKLDALFVLHISASQLKHLTVVVTGPLWPPPSILKNLGVVVIFLLGSRLRSSLRATIHMSVYIHLEVDLVHMVTQTDYVAIGDCV